MDLTEVVRLVMIRLENYPEVFCFLCKDLHVKLKAACVHSLHGWRERKNSLQQEASLAAINMNTVFL